MPTHIPGSKLFRPVRPRREPSEEIEDVAASSEIESQDSQKSPSHSPPPASENDSASEDDQAIDTSNISFGALLKAQASLQRQKTRTTTATTPRKRSRAPDDTWDNAEAQERRAGHHDTRTFSRPNKHAPTEVSSKVPVSRYRQIIAPTGAKARDPRFDATAEPFNAVQFKRDYAFLDGYRKAEMEELRACIKAAVKARDGEAAETLRAELRVLESQQRARERKEREEEVIDRHRREEKELVKQGKKPFYLKRGEMKKRVLVEEFKGMKGAKAEHAIERRRKKLASREMRNLPVERRMGGA